MSTELKRVIMSDMFLKCVSLVLRSKLWIEYYIQPVKEGRSSISITTSGA